MNIIDILDEAEKLTTVEKAKVILALFKSPGVGFMLGGIGSTKQLVALYTAASKALRWREGKRPLLHVQDAIELVLEAGEDTVVHQDSVAYSFDGRGLIVATLADGYQLFADIDAPELGWKN